MTLQARYVHPRIDAVAIAFMVMFAAWLGVRGNWGGVFTTAIVLGGSIGQLRTRYVSLTADHGVIRAHAALQETVVDLRQGFTIAPARYGKERVFLEAGHRKLTLQWFGTVDEVEAWLKEAQVAV